jgi:hypothetical protein
VANGLSAGQVFHRVRWTDGSWTPFQPVPGTPDNTQQIAIAAEKNYLPKDRPGTNIVAVKTSADGRSSEFVRTYRDFVGQWADGWVTVGLPAGVQVSSASDVAMFDNTYLIDGVDTPAVGLVFSDATGNAYWQLRINTNVPGGWTTSAVRSQRLIAGQASSVWASKVVDHRYFGAVVTPGQ